MKKKRLLILCLCFILTACKNKESDTSDASLDIEPASTGYPAEELQREYVMVNDNLYVNSFEEVFIVEPPADFVLYGTVEKCNNTELPNENLMAAHMDIGTELLVNAEATSQIYVKYPSGAYQKFILYKE